MLCSTVTLYGHYNLEFNAISIGPVFWTKIVYMGIFGFLYTFPRFATDLIDKKIRLAVKWSLCGFTIAILILTAFTNLIITDRIAWMLGVRESARGPLFPFVIALTFVVIIYYYTRIIAAARKKSIVTANYVPILFTIGFGIVFGIIDLIGMSLNRPVIPWIPEPFIVSIFIVSVGFLWTYISQYSWVLNALDKSEKEITKLVDRSNQSFMEFVGLIAKTLDAKDHYTAGHSLRVMDCSVKIARTLKLPEVEIEILKQACLLHDIGKIKIPDGILNKKSSLTEKEREFIYQHPLVGRQILSTVSDFQDILDVIYAHHERIDGNGYPRGLKKDEIPLLARILSVADAYDAMRSERPYRRPKNKIQAQTELERVKGTQLDPLVVDTLLGIIVSEGSG
jgi:putative nucleotidyltransferase with HDIG domain